LIASFFDLETPHFNFIEINFWELEYLTLLFKISIFLFQFCIIYHAQPHSFYHPSFQQFISTIHLSRAIFLFPAVQCFVFFQSFFSYSFSYFEHISFDLVKIVRDL